jgi:succinate dehydrogenase/fumarate reductase flavoprotein subunit
MLDLVVINGQARGIVCRNLITGELESYAGDAVVLCTGGYGNAYFLATYAKNSNATAIWRCHKRGAFFANPCFTQIHPTCIPVTGDYQSKLTLMSESLRNDGRVWVPQEERRHPPAQRDPRRREGLLSGAQVPQLREPRPTGYLVPRGQSRLRRGARRRRVGTRRLSRFLRYNPREGHRVH